MKYLSPRSDIGFKKLFGNMHHKNITISFLNSILGLRDQQAICSIEFRDTEQLPENEDGRKSFFDVYCTDASGKNFIIEMQGKYQAHFIVRAQYYTSLAFYRQVHTPFKYEKLVPVIFIGVLDHILDDRHEDVISCHKLMDIAHKTESSQHQVYYFIELAKFNKRIEECRSDIDKWLYFITQADKIDKVPVEFQESANFKEAFYILERSQWKEWELDAYLAQADKESEQERYLQGAEEQGVKKGLKKGLEQGLQQGKQEGLQEGLQQGKQEGLQEGLEQGLEMIALNGLRTGLDIGLIAMLTGFSIEKIQDLKDKL